MDKNEKKKDKHQRGWSNSFCVKIDIQFINFHGYEEEIEICWLCVFWHVSRVICVSINVKIF